MDHYFAVVHKDEDSAWGVWFPDVPGCFAAADLLEGVVPAAAEALSLWMEDEVAPVPRAIEAIRALADVARDLAEGAFLLAVPVIALTGRTAKANITMDAGLLQAIDATAKKRGMTRSALLADLARRELMR